MPQPTVHGRNCDSASRVTLRKLQSAAARARIQADFFGVPVGTAPACWSCVGAPSTSYEPRSPAQGALYQIVRDHFETFRAQAASLRDGEGLPRFVEQEFRGFLQCGWLAGGFARFHCDDCALDRLVPFSCKSRAVCPSCGGRRMAERAAHLLDHVFPDVPIRQWVLSLPYRLRYQLAWNHDVCRGVVAVFVRSVLGFLRARARDDGVVDGRGGAVAVIQRFGGALNLNRHVHVLALDGVFARTPGGPLTFHPTGRLTALDVEEVLATVEPHMMRLLDRRGLGESDDDRSVADAWAEDAPALTGLAAASVQGIVALGPQRGARLRHLGDPREEGELPGRGKPSCAGERLRSARGARRPSGTTGSARAGVSLCAETAGDAGADPPDRRGPGAAAAPAAVARWDDGCRVRPCRVSRAAGGAGATTAHQPDFVPWRAGTAGGLAG
jgi:hypothetical protein